VNTVETAELSHAKLVALRDFAATIVRSHSRALATEFVNRVKEPINIIIKVNLTPSRRGRNRRAYFEKNLQRGSAVNCVS